jgi:phosphoribosyl 1,2-cyclic phosphate phosphodiesterase
MKLRILGCGDSSGVPSINGYWGACDPAHPKNFRTRTSLSLEHGGECWVIDTGPDLKQQMLREKLTRLDGVFFTHAHADHVMGLHELRVFYGAQKKNIPVYGDDLTLTALQKAFGYLFCDEDPQLPPPIYPKFLVPQVLNGPFQWHGMAIHPWVQNHGYSLSMGYRFPTWAYSTDVLELDDQAFETFKGIRLWFVDCIDWVPRPSHAHLEKTLSWIERVKPEKAILIHMNKMIDYERLRQHLPPHIQPAFDGMQIQMPSETNGEIILC